jgi:hypothetical protein
MMEFLDLINAVMQWIVVPVAGGLLMMYRIQQTHATQIAVLQAVHEANKEAHDREFKEMRENFRRIFEKLDTIEGVLRK